MDNWFNNKWFVRGVSLAFAILLYVLVNIEMTTTQSDSESRVPGGSDKTQTLNDVPVNIRIDSERFVVSGVPEYVTLSLEGPNSTLNAMVLQRNFEVYVDLEDLEEGTHMVDIDYAKIPSELTVYIEPKTTEVEIEERASEDFAVSVDFINKDQLPVGYELSSPELNPNEVTITSSRSVIDQIAMVKVYLDVAGLTEPIKKREIPINVYDSQGNVLNTRIDPESVVVSVDVDNPSKKVPINVPTTGGLPDRFTLTTITSEIDEIEVFATSDVLDEMEELATEEIDLSDITESGTMDVKLDIPDDVTVSKKEVEVTIEIEQTRTIDTLPIEIINGEGQDITFNEPDQAEMSVTIIGDEKEIRELSLDDFKLSIDVAGLDEGEHKIAVSIEGPDDVIAEVEFEEVIIQIT